MKIAIPDHPLYAPLVAHADRVCADRGWQLVRAPIEQCGAMLFTHAVDAALVSPMGYGRGVTKVDYRIVGGPALMLHDFTNVAGISFAPTMSALRTAVSHTPAECLVTLGMLILSEKLDVILTMHPAGQAEADCMIDLAGVGSAFAMDVSEEWADLTDAPLPAALWVCRIEADQDAVAGAVAAMADATTETPVSEMLAPTSDHVPRQGRITYRWTDETEDALAAVLDMLYFHQLLPEIPAVKLLGRD